MCEYVCVCSLTKRERLDNPPDGIVASGAQGVTIYGAADTQMNLFRIDNAEANQPSV